MDGRPSASSEATSFLTPTPKELTRAYILTSNKGKFACSDDVAMLRHVLRWCPWEAAHGSVMATWDRVAEDVAQSPDFKLKGKTGAALKSRFETLLVKFCANDMQRLRKLGTPAEFAEREVLLTDIRLQMQGPSEADETRAEDEDEDEDENAGLIELATASGGTVRAIEVSSLYDDEPSTANEPRAVDGPSSAIHEAAVQRPSTLEPCTPDQDNGSSSRSSAECPLKRKAATLDAEENSLNASLVRTLCENRTRDAACAEATLALARDRLAFDRDQARQRLEIDRERLAYERERLEVDRKLASVLAEQVAQNQRLLLAIVDKLSAK
ncbi:hypothetical protein SPRG_05316 [Saprolegnia parasitica CBS 223.65]|uniref:Uncharacterized protein n=1 Tax=Saprolegnia parasitica (strain CBS 223.65) TaxID=695850 RepID=A0A067CHB0_SAPPC|nr:hypothetical protein SPRG_05316 [Saprolegnia parasitica CBS 223.65]KDO30124.1 hypothetical protein SPRG_05316 [Saprolegnia parasitica CBS 223.65]|eukprot:XP_012199303.1 hypothetical protein SPRG_05316 [Saprolegnia parasitica CBS 223.65]